MAEKKQGVDYLNKIRANPGAYSDQIGVNMKDLKPTHALVWNEALAKAAQAKAQDMAKRNYMAHVDPDGNGMNIKINQAGYKLRPDWYNDKSKNNFESLSAGRSTIKESIKSLINDGQPNHEKAGHRIHLLGLKQFWANCKDIGIGFANNPKSTYKNYCCVLVAKHDF